MASTGYLTARVFTSTAQLPIRNATVAVTQNGDNGTRQLAVRLTDESGRTPRISLPTPELQGSLTPGTVSPFTTVNLTVEYPGYERVLVEGLQIFPGIITEQEVELLPIEDLPEYYNMTELIEIPSQEL
ncbi:MAG: spore cortex-lytic protein [Oscillospiraceae bacterium]|nr:spore cortex-lytic protein [Oscillospiraceae bacterium]